MKNNGVETETISDILLSLHKELTYSDRFNKEGTYEDCRRDMYERLEELIHGRHDTDNCNDQRS